MRQSIGQLFQSCGVERTRPVQPHPLQHTRAGGFGLRVALSPEERINLRLDFGFGEETSGGPYIEILEAF